MAVDYKSKIGTEGITPILDEYVVWYGKLVRAYLEEVPMKDAPPSIFADWILQAELPEHIADRAKKIHFGMVQAARGFAIKFAQRYDPPVKEYAELSRHYEEFIHFMHRLEMDLASENSGYDKRTGLRSAKLMKEDIGREMERRARRGHPFSIALVKINNYKEEWRGAPSKTQTMIQSISELVKQSLRSFDDAYYLGEEYFVLSLKHADMVGAQAALNRLNSALQQSPVHAPENPEEEIAISSVFCEPAEGIAIDDLLANLKKDVETITEKGAVVQYNDLSPIQRYIHSIEGDK